MSLTDMLPTLSCLYKAVIFMGLTIAPDHSSGKLSEKKKKKKKKRQAL